MQTKEHVSETKQLLEENAHGAPVKDVLWNANEINVESETKIQDDAGVGEAAIIRMFEFAINFQAFQEHKPTKQELFNSHYKGIEAMLWRDGMKVIPEVNPKIILGKKKYRIFVGAKPQRGHLLHERPQTLSQVFNV